MNHSLSIYSSFCSTLARICHMWWLHCRKVFFVLNSNRSWRTVRTIFLAAAQWTSPAIYRTLSSAYLSPYSGLCRSSATPSSIQNQMYDWKLLIWQICCWTVWSELITFQVTLKLQLPSLIFFFPCKRNSLYQLCAFSMLIDAQF